MTTAVLCAHHWEIERANGHTSRGRCLKCGEEKDFLNAIPEDGLEYGWRKRREEQMPKLKGGNITARGKSLKPARKKAEGLLRQGMMARDVQVQLRPEFGEIAISTIQGWKTRMAPVRHRTDKPIPEPAQSHTDVIPLWDTVLASKPDWTDKAKCAAWKRLLDAVFEWMMA